MNANYLYVKKSTGDDEGNHQIVDYDAVLDAKFGKVCTQECKAFRREAYAY